LNFTADSRIDGFAGPGVYEKGQIGSPIISLQCLVSHSLNLCEERKDTEFLFLFFEEEEERAKILKGQIAERFPTRPPNVLIHVEHGKFEDIINKILDQIEDHGKNLAPTFAFIDPFGYSGLPFYLVQRILSYRSCEVFINFAFNSINRFIETYDGRQEIFDGLFGTNEWSKTRAIKNPTERNAVLTKIYTEQLKSVARYVRSFEMVNNQGNVAYYLYFATNHQLGFQQMKRAMWKVDPRGSYRFADTTDVGVRFLISFDEGSKYRDQADSIYRSFDGKNVPIEEIEQFCIDATPFPYLWKSSLKILEREGKLSVDKRTKNMTYPSGCNISFKQS